MKNRLKIVGIIFLFLQIGLQGHAQKKIKTHQIIGSWTLNYDISRANTNEKSKNHISKMKQEKRQRIEQGYKNRQLTFSENGDLLIVFSDGRQINGKWTTKKGNILEFENSKGSVKTYHIKKLTANTLILKTPKTGLVNVMIDQLYFTKTNTKN